MLVFDLQGGHSSQWHEGARLTSAAASSWEAVSAKRRGSCQEPLGGQQAAVETTLPSPPPPSLFLSLPRLSACPSLPISVSVSLSLSLSAPLPSPSQDERHRLPCARSVADGTVRAKDRVAQGPSGPRCGQGLGSGREILGDGTASQESRRAEVNPRWTRAEAGPLGWLGAPECPSRQCGWCGGSRTGKGQTSAEGWGWRPQCQRAPHGEGEAATGSLRPSWPRGLDVSSPSAERGASSRLRGQRDGPPPACQRAASRNGDTSIRQRDRNCRAHPGFQLGNQLPRHSAECLRPAGSPPDLLGYALPWLPLLPCCPRGRAWAPGCLPSLAVPISSHHRAPASTLSPGCPLL